jgi:hypothetical protein
MMTLEASSLSTSMDLWWGSRFTLCTQIFRKPSAKFANVCCFSNFLCPTSIPHSTRFFVHISLVGFSTFALVAVSLMKLRWRLVYLRVAIWVHFALSGSSTRLPWFSSTLELFFMPSTWNCFFLSVGSSHDCLKIQSDLNRLARLRRNFIQQNVF